MNHPATSSASTASSKTPAPTSSCPLLQAENIHKYFRSGSQNLHILRGVNLTLFPGQWLAILGASGCGKSTLLHLLGGLDRPDQGTITHQSKNLFQQPASAIHQYRNKTIGFVFQFYHLLPEFSALENVALAAMIGSSIPGWFKNRKSIRQRAAELLTQVGLEHRLHHRPSKLSGGERQRVAIARALINQPHILLADEPTGNLDADTGKQILDIFQALHKQGQSIIMVTHDARIASLADQRLKLHQGQLVDHLPSSAI